tara:strand:+ start:297 stop:1079 length:783 start_codon:yes stop_codon:yes gene_type:complete
MISTSDKTFFIKNGYLLKKNFFTKKKCKNILSILLKYADNKYSPILNMDRFEFVFAQSKEKLNKLNTLSKTVNFIKETQNNTNLIKKFFLNEKLLKNLNFLYSRKIVGLQTQVIFKKPSTKYSKQSFNEHQDNSYAKNSKGLFFTAHTFLSKTSKKNGCIYVYSKSHKLKLLKFKKKISFREKNYKPGNKVSNIKLKKFKKIDMIGNAGDLLIMHGHLVHGSYPNISKNLSRPIFAGCYIPEGEHFVAGKNAQRKVIKLD